MLTRSFLAVCLAWFALHLVNAQDPYETPLDPRAGREPLTPVQRNSQMGDRGQFRAETAPPAGSTRFVPVADETSGTNAGPSHPDPSVEPSFLDRDPSLLPYPNAKDTTEPAPAFNYDANTNTNAPSLDPASVAPLPTNQTEFVDTRFGQDRDPRSERRNDPLNPNNPPTSQGSTSQGSVQTQTNPNRLVSSASSPGTNDQNDANALTSNLASRSNPMILLVLLASLSANIYLGWIAWDTYNRYQDLVGDIRTSRSRRERGSRRSDRDYDVESAEPVLS